VSPDKEKKIVSELKKGLHRIRNMSWLASDEDREGEAIAWHPLEIPSTEKRKYTEDCFP